MENWVGTRIKNLRKVKGLTQEELAELCNVSPSCISRWETGNLFPRRENLILLSKVLDVSPEEILNISNAAVSEDKVIMECVFLLEKLTPDERNHIFKLIQWFFEAVPRPSPDNNDYNI